MASAHHVRDIVASNIKRLRKARGITQAQLAEMTDLSSTYIANIECGKTWISDRTLERLSAALETEFHVFFDIDDATQPNEAISTPQSIQKQLQQLNDNYHKLLPLLEQKIKECVLATISENRMMQVDEEGGGDSGFQPMPPSENKSSTHLYSRTNVIMGGGGGC